PRELTVDDDRDLRVSPRRVEHEHALLAVGMRSRPPGERRGPRPPAAPKVAGTAPRPCSYDRDGRLAPRAAPPIVSCRKWRYSCGEPGCPLPNPSDLRQGTLDLLILKTIARDPLHGWGISKRIQLLSDDTLSVGQGSLYPALHRLEQQGWIRAEWK